MDQKQLREYLEQLDSSIESLEGADEQQRAQLQGLINDIEQQLAADALPADQGSLSDQLDQLISEFETEHPTVSGILNNILVTLSSMGV